MTVVAIDGFDMYNGTGANTGLQAKWVPLSSTTGASMVAGRFGGQALRVANASANAIRTWGRTFTAGASIAVGFAFRTDVLPATVCPIAFFMNGATHMDGLQLDTAGKLLATRQTGASPGSSTTLGTSAAVIVANTWHYIEVELTVSDTVGVFNVYVDGTAVLSLSAQDTRNGTPTTIDTFEVGVSSGNPGPSINADFDDLYIVNTAATKLGERRIQTLYPSADTAQKDFTPNTGGTNYTQVKEAQCDGDTSYVQASTVGNTDRYDFDDLTGSPATIDVVQFSAFGEKTDATSRSIALQVKSGATTSDGSNFALASSYGKFERLMATDPNGSIAWATAAVNALQGGPKVTV